MKWLIWTFVQKEIICAAHSQGATDKVSVGLERTSIKRLAKKEASRERREVWRDIVKRVYEEHVHTSLEGGARQWRSQK